MYNSESYRKRMEWFTKARFGMFIHFGLYAIPARGEWIKSIERIEDKDYQQYFDEFNPDQFDAREWAKTIRDAGMKYVVLTAKHHDGFCLFDSQYTDYKSTNTLFGRDIIREYVDAMRAEGIGVGLYYSLLDWHHPDYPHYGDLIHPMRDNENYKDKEIHFDNYLQYMYNQVEELCTNYGKLDVLWFDFSYADLYGEKWKATELINMVRKHQPDIIINNRLDKGMDNMLSDYPPVYSGDFASPEQLIPPEGITNQKGEPIPWESCITMNNNWGYHRYDHEYKSASLCIRTLAECVSKGGNLLLNVGPDARGCFPQECVKILNEIGHWMKKNSESIYGCGPSPLPKPDRGWLTAKENKLYYHITDAMVGPIALKLENKDDIKSIRFLATKSEVSPTTDFTAGLYPEYLFMFYGPDRNATYKLPDDIDTVIEIEFHQK